MFKHLVWCETKHANSLIFTVYFWQQKYKMPMQYLAYIKKKKQFIWNSNLPGHPVFYLEILLELSTRMWFLHIFFLSFYISTLIFSIWSCFPFCTFSRPQGKLPAVENYYWQMSLPQAFANTKICCLLSVEWFIICWFRITCM